MLGNQLSKALFKMQIQDTLKETFKKFPSIYSVYNAGSYLTEHFNSNSDIDLSIILETPKYEEINGLEKEIKKIETENKIKISTCYSEMSHLKKDIEKFGLHSHGKKRSSFIYDLLNAQILYGQDLKLEGYTPKYHPYEVYSNFSEVINEIYNHLDNPVKCVNLALVAAKTTLLLKGSYPTKKKEIIRQFSDKINRPKGNKLSKAYSTKKADIQFLIDFCYYCKDYARDLVEVSSCQTKQIK